MHVWVARVAVGLLGLASLAAVAPGAVAQVSTPTVDVAVEGHAFVPPTVTILKGTLVRWTNMDLLPDGVHTATSDTDATTGFDKPLLTKEAHGTGLDIGSQTFTALGTSAYHCRIHSNMHGTVVVVATLTAPVVKVVAKDDGNNYRFDPPSIKINMTQKVNFTNGGSARHNLVFEDAALGPLGDLQAGKNITVTFPKTGFYKFRCGYHSQDFQSGMHGDVLVGNATLPKAPPILKFTTPSAGSVVKGTVDVGGTVASGTGNVNATGVEVRVAGGAWAAATLKGTAWSFSWDTTAVKNGDGTLEARALSKEFPNPDPVKLVVKVDNPVAASNGVAKTVEKKKGTLPGFEGTLLALAFLAAALPRRRV